MGTFPSISQSNRRSQAHSHSVIAAVRSRSKVPSDVRSLGSVPHGGACMRRSSSTCWACFCHSGQGIARSPRRGIPERTDHGGVAVMGLVARVITVSQSLSQPRRLSLPQALRSTFRVCAARQRLRRRPDRRSSPRARRSTAKLETLRKALPLPTAAGRARRLIFPRAACRQRTIDAHAASEKFEATSSCSSWRAPWTRGKTTVKQTARFASAHGSRVFLSDTRTRVTPLGSHLVRATHKLFALRVTRTHKLSQQTLSR